jgi:RimJ/RimL family protein N-acetyltransferase
VEVILKDLDTTQSGEFTGWIANKEVIKYSLSAFLPDRDENWVRSFITSLKENTTTWDQAIIFDGAVVGYCGLTNLSNQNRSGEYYILIGDQKYWNRGLGTLVGRKVLEFGFKDLGLHRIWLTVSELNHGGIKSYEKLGFIEEGRMKEACFRDGQFHDKIVMSVIGNNWC